MRAECLICNSTEVDVRNDMYGDGKLDRLQCQNCGHAWTSPCGMYVGAPGIDEPMAAFTFPDTYYNFYEMVSEKISGNEPLLAQTPCGSTFHPYLKDLISLGGVTYRVEEVIFVADELPKETFLIYLRKL